MMRSNLLLFSLLLTTVSFGQNVPGPQASQQLGISPNEASFLTALDNVGVQGSGIASNSHIQSPAWYTSGPGARSAIVNVTFDTSFPELAKPAVERAADIWAQSIETVVPVQIQVFWDSLPPNYLGFGSPYEVLHDFEGAELANRQYAIALANQMAGQDLNPEAPDFVIRIAKDAQWHFGLDGQPEDDEYDLVTVALHEMAHGLGFLGSANHNGTSGFIGFQGIPFAFDQFVEESDGTPVLDYTSGTIGLGDVLESDALYWSGDYGQEAQPIGRPRLYAPSSWFGSASFSHLREGSYPSGDANSLMTPFLGTAEVIHNPGAIALGMMRDIGWDLPPVLCSILDVVALEQTPCNPQTNAYSQTLQITYENAPENGSLVVNGQSFFITGSPQTLTLTGLQSDGEDVEVEVVFSENLECSLTAPALFTAPEACCVRLRLSEVNPETKTLTVRNVAGCDGGLDGHVVKSGGAQVLLTDLLPVGAVIPSSATLSIEWPGWPDNVDGGDLTLHDQFGPFDDYVQWGTSGNAGEFIATLYNLWTPDTFLEGLPPYVYEGDPYASPAEHGLGFWSAQPFPCEILGVTVGATSPCNGIGNVFTQELTFDFQSPPPSGDIILVQDSLVAYDGSNPWNVVLTLPATGESVDITATVLGDPACTATYPGLVQSPESCGCPTDLNNGGFVDVTDLLLFLTDYGCMSGCTADFNDDGIVNVTDLLIFLTTYGSSCI